MNKKTLAGLIVIVVITSVAIFAGCAEKGKVTPSGPTSTPLAPTATPEDTSTSIPTPLPEPERRPVGIQEVTISGELVGIWGYRSYTDTRYETYYQSIPGVPGQRIPVTVPVQFKCHEYSLQSVAIKDEDGNLIAIRPVFQRQRLFVNCYRYGTPNFSNSTETINLVGHAYTFRAPSFSNESLLCKDKHISHSGKQVTVTGLLKPQRAFL